MQNYRTRAGLFSILILAVAISSCFRQPAKILSPDELIVFPPPPAETKIQFLHSFSTSIEFSGPQSGISKFLFGEEQVLPIIKPYGIHIHGSKIYICDSGIGGLEILDLKDGSFSYFIPRGRGQLQFPINSFVDEQGMLYIADGNRRQVLIFDADGKYVDAITLENNGKPTAVFVDDSRIWISAVDQHGIQVFDKKDLSFETSFPNAKPKTNDYLYQPANITANDSILYISDIGGCRVVTFNKSMEYRNSFGTPGQGFGQFTRPKGIAVDREGKVYVVDAAFENVQVFNPEGQVLMHFGGGSREGGGMYLPAGIAIDYDACEYFSQYVATGFALKYIIFVINQYGPHKVSVYGFVEPGNKLTKGE